MSLKMYTRKDVVVCAGLAVGLVFTLPLAWIHPVCSGFPIFIAYGIYQVICEEDAYYQPDVVKSIQPQKSTTHHCDHVAPPKVALPDIIEMTRPKDETKSSVRRRCPTVIVTDTKEIDCLLPSPSTKPKPNADSMPTTTHDDDGAAVAPNAELPVASDLARPTDEAVSSVHHTVIVKDTKEIDRLLPFSTKSSNSFQPKFITTGNKNNVLRILRQLHVTHKSNVAVLNRTFVSYLTEAIVTITVLSPSEPVGPTDPNLTIEQIVALDFLLQELLAHVANGDVDLFVVGQFLDAITISTPSGDFDYKLTYPKGTAALVVSGFSNLETQNPASVGGGTIICHRHRSTTFDPVNFETFFSNSVVNIPPSAPPAPPVAAPAAQTPEERKKSVLKRVRRWITYVLACAKCASCL